MCYFGRTPEAAFVEVFFRRLPSVAVAWSELASRALVEVRLAREVTLVCLAGPGLLRLGVSASVVLDPRSALVAAWIRRYGFPVFDDR